MGLNYIIVLHVVYMQVPRGRGRVGAQSLPRSLLSFKLSAMSSRRAARAPFSTCVLMCPWPQVGSRPVGPAGKSSSKLY